MSAFPTSPDANISAYDLLSMPTLSLTDAQVDTIIVDLRKRRALYITSGKADRAPTKSATSPAAKLSADEKARNTAALLAQLKLS